jgi:hypothetical protein
MASGLCLARPLPSRLQVCRAALQRDDVEVVGAYHRCCPSTSPPSTARSTLLLAPLVALALALAHC